MLQRIDELSEKINTLDTLTKNHDESINEIKYQNRSMSESLSSIQDLLKALLERTASINARLTPLEGERRNNMEEEIDQFVVNLPMETDSEINKKKRPALNSKGSIQQSTRAHTRKRATKTDGLHEKKGIGGRT